MTLVSARNGEFSIRVLGDTVTLKAAHDVWMQAEHRGADLDTQVSELLCGANVCEEVSMTGWCRDYILTNLSTEAQEFVERARVAVDISDSVHCPAHYNVGGVEVIVAIEAWALGFCLGNAVKYVARAAHKNNGAKEVEDLKKARWYLDREIARLEEGL